MDPRGGGGGGGRSIVRSFNRTERQRNRNRAATDRISHSNIQLLFDHSFEVAFEYSFEYPFDESFVYSSDCLLESSFDYPLAYVCAIENSLDCSVTYSSIDSFMFFYYSLDSFGISFRATRSHWGTLRSIDRLVNPTTALQSQPLRSWHSLAPTGQMNT